MASIADISPVTKAHGKKFGHSHERNLVTRPQPPSPCSRHVRNAAHALACLARPFHRRPPSVLPQNGRPCPLSDRTAVEAAVACAECLPTVAAACRPCHTGRTGDPVATDDPPLNNSGDLAGDLRSSDVPMRYAEAPSQRPTTLPHHIAPPPQRPPIRKWSTAHRPIVPQFPRVYTCATHWINEACWRR